MQRQNRPSLPPTAAIPQKLNPCSTIRNLGGQCLAGQQEHQEICWDSVLAGMILHPQLQWQKDLR